MLNVIYAGKNIIQGLMKNVLSVAPSSTLTKDDVQELWDGLDTPPAPIEAWNYSLNNEESSVTLQQYIGSEENVTVYASYDVEAANYNTKIASNDDNSEDYMFAGNDTVQTVTFEEGVDTSETVNMSNMFASCMSLRSVNLSAVNTENTTSMANMFSDCESLEEVSVDIHNWVVNEECDTTGMFEGSSVTEETYINEHEYDETDHCTICGQLNPEHQHSYVEEITTEPTCETTGVRTYTCKCGHSYTEEIPALGHDFGEYITDVEATCDTAGSKSQHCSRCDATQNVTEIPAWGHDYEEPVYTWSDDNSTCTASRTCITDGYVDTETVNATSEVTIEPGCETTGIRAYTAEFTNTTFAKQLKNETIDALGHTYVDGICSVCGAEDPDYVPIIIEVAPDGELANWNYTLDDTNGTITLNYFNNTTATSVTIYGKYQLDGVEYDTKIASNDSNATSNYMFAGRDKIQTITFKKGIDTSNITNMSSMFYFCKVLTSITGLEYFNTSNVTSMYSMFYDCRVLTSLNLTSFDTSKVTDMSQMFYRCKVLTSLDLTSFDTSKVTNMGYMFYVCNTLTSLNVSGFDTSKVTDMEKMFYGCKILSSLDLTSFDTSNVTNMYCMFYECKALTTLDLTSFDTSKVTTMGSMFYGCNTLTSLDLTGWNISNVTTMNSMFYNCTSLTSTSIIGLENLDTSNVTDMKQMFYNCTSLTSFDLTSFDTSNVTNMTGMFDGCTALTSLDLSGWNTSNVTYMSDMFYNCTSLTSIIGLENWNTSKVTYMSVMFYNCTSLTSTSIIGLENWNTSNVTNMTGMFTKCTSLTSLDLTSFDTSNVTNMSSMFYGCTALISIDVSKWNTSNVTDMSSMFNGCYVLTTINGLENFDTSNVTNMNSMFYRCKALSSLDLTSFDTSKVTKMNSMFYECKALTSLNLTSFSTSNVTTMNSMFYNCTSLRQILVSEGKWLINEGCNTSNMFKSCGTSSVIYMDAA